MQILYRTSKTGKVLSWETWTEGNIIFTRHGQVDGQLQLDQKIIEEGTNIGRSNERTPDEQAEFLALAKWKHQKKYKGYVEDIRDEKRVGLKTCGDGGIVVMKATPYEEKLMDSIGFPCYVQPKLDGVRATCHSGKLFSSGGLEYHWFKDIIEEVNSLGFHGILDGELYKHGMYLKDISGIARQSKQDKVNHEDKASLEYWIFDCPAIDHEEDILLNYSLRMKHIFKLFEGKGFKKIRIIPNYIVHNKEQLMQKYTEFVMEGYEGAIVRDMEMPFTQNRSKVMLKIKDFTDEEFPIIGVNEGVGEHKGIASSFTCLSKDGKEFGAGVLGTLAYRKELFENPHMWQGKQVTVRYLQYWDGKPQIAKAHTKLGLKDCDVVGVHIRPEDE